MIVDGKQIASEILDELKLRVGKLAQKGIIPTLAVILMGDEESSIVYIKQKELKASEIGATSMVYRFEENVTEAEIEELVRKLDKDPDVHGIILQRPAPKTIDVEKLEELISPQKEVDGFGSHPIYPVPVAQAVLIILKKAYENSRENTSFEKWLLTRKIVVLGKGETAGLPIINHFIKLGVTPLTIDSKTQNGEDPIKNADILISAVGKANAFDFSWVKKGAILVGVGLSMDKDGKTQGDFKNTDAEAIASFYSPTPGGVGPVNVACLMQNLVEAAEKSSGQA
jgi:methylenetetrahydrofolate dehydrogenase (NADP+)/methenyltetrahydrofolate cyclohydrolase